MAPYSVLIFLLAGKNCVYSWVQLLRLETHQSIRSSLLILLYQQSTGQILIAIRRFRCVDGCTKRIYTFFQNVERPWLMLIVQWVACKFVTAFSDPPSIFIFFYFLPIFLFFCLFLISSSSLSFTSHLRLDFSPAPSAGFSGCFPLSADLSRFYRRGRSSSFRWNDSRRLRPFEPRRVKGHGRGSDGHRPPIRITQRPLPAQTRPSTTRQR